MDRCYLFAGKQSSLIATGVLVQGTASLERCAGSCSGDGVFSMLSVDVEIAAGGRRGASGVLSPRTGAQQARGSTCNVDATIHGENTCIIGDLAENAQIPLTGPAAPLL